MDGEFIESSTEREQEERLNYGGKMMKDLSADSVNDVLLTFGKDLQAMNGFVFYGKSLGIDGAHLGLLNPGQFSQPSATQDEKNMWAEQELAEKLDKERKKIVAHAKKAAKPFDVSYVKTILASFQRDRQTRLAAKQKVWRRSALSCSSM